MLNQRGERRLQLRRAPTGAVPNDAARADYLDALWGAAKVTPLFSARDGAGSVLI